MMIGVLVSYIDIEKRTWDDEENKNDTSTIHCTVEELDAIDNQGEEGMSNTTIIHGEEHMGIAKDVDNTIPDESVKNIATTHEEEHMGTAKDVDNTILDESVKNTATTYKEEHMGTNKVVENTIQDES